MAKIIFLELDKKMDSPIYRINEQTKIKVQATFQTYITQGIFMINPPATINGIPAQCPQPIVADHGPSP